MRRILAHKILTVFRNQERVFFAVVSALTVVFASVVAVPVSGASGATNSKGPLQIAGNSQVGATYTLYSLATCDVFDALTLMKNVGTKPVRLTDVHAMIPTESVPVKDKITYQLITYKAGSTTGEVGAVENMSTRGGTIVGNAVGDVLQPISKSSLWYIVVFRMKVVQPHSAEWVVRGVRVSYTVGTKMYHVVFPQTVRLPKTGC